MSTAPEQPPDPRPWAVVDLDGVVADTRHRLHHVERRPKDWRSFFAAAVDDPVLDEGRAVVSRLVQDHELVYLTGRPESCREDTERWLAHVGLPEARLVMRGARDHRPSRLVKVQELRRLARSRPVGVVVDDDPAVVAAVRAAGFTVLHAEWMAEQPALFEAQEVDGAT